MNSSASWTVSRSLALLALAATATTASSQTLPLHEAERVPEPQVDPASDDAKLAIQRFIVPKDLQVSLWAAEPMLANPVAIDFDEKGRLFVSETHRYRSSVLDIRDYMGMLELDLAARTVEDRTAYVKKVFGEQFKQFEIESEIVRRVTDTDGDGVADKSEIFAGDFDSDLDGIASGVLARKGKVWFTNIPSLWLLEEGADGKLAKRDELLRGFGVRFNYTGHDFHGLAIGPDGKLYYSIGDRGAHVKGKEGQVVDVPDEGAVFRSNLDGTDFELVARGLRNPQELVFDDHGNLFTGDNDSDQSDMERLVYVVEGGDSGWRVGYQHAPLGRGGPWISENLWRPQFPGRAAYLLPPVCNIEDGPSGLTYYPGTGLTPEYAGHFFITHFKGSIARSGVQTYTIKEDGASFKPTSSKLFVGGLLPTDVTFAPDGTFYLSDWVEGWPKSKKGRIYGLTPVNETAEQKAQRKQVAELLAQDLTRKSVGELRTLLGHADKRVRQEAQFALVELGKPGGKALTQVVRDAQAKPLARLHAVWGLTQLGRKEASHGKTLLGLLGDKDAEVRAQAAKGLGDLAGRVKPQGSTNSYAALVKALNDPAPRVQFFAAQSLGKLGNPEATPALLALLERNADKDAYIRHAAVHALTRIGKNAALDAAAKNPSSAVRLGVLLVYRQLQDGAIAQFLDDRNAFIVAEAAHAINDAPVDAARPALAAKLGTTKADPVALRVINANYRMGTADNAAALAKYAARTDVSATLRAEAVTQLGLWGKAPQRDRIVGIYRPLPARDGQVAAAALSNVVHGLLGDSPEAVKLAAIDAVKNLKLTSAAGALVAAVANDKAEGAVRAAALNALDVLDVPETTRGIEAAERSNAPALRLAALQIVARRSPEKALPIIRKLATDGNEAEQRAAFTSLAALNRPETPQMLVLGLDRLAAGKIAPGAQTELLDTAEASGDARVKARVEKLKAQWAAGSDPLAPYRFALAGGNAWRGSNQFYDNPVLPCGRCHKVNGEGGDAGPDLSRIGTQLSAEKLLEAVVKPNASIAPGFDIVTLTLKDGATETGSLVRESANEIVLKRADGSEFKATPAQIASRAAAPSSMPEIYGQVMTRAQLRDLMAFLKTRDDAPPARMGEAPARAMMENVAPAEAGGHP